MAGDILIDEIGLILSAITAYEGDFFSTLSDKTDNNIDIGLTFFVEVVGAFWESVTGERVFQRGGGEEPESNGFRFIRDCIGRLIDIDTSILLKVAQPSLR